MDPDSLAASVNNAPRKVKFQPKGPPRRAAKLVVPKQEKSENDVDLKTEEGLLRRLNESSLKTKLQAERKGGPARVAFGYGAFHTVRSYGQSKVKNNHQGSSSDGVDVEQREEEEYKEPWDYYSHYPVTLPMRRPYSGNPELLDEEEFGEGSQSLTSDEHSINPAIDLGLMKENPEALIFFQLPSILPMTKQTDSKVSNETTNSSKTSEVQGPPPKACSLEELPAGFMGKMLVYKSGAVKMKLGDTIYDVSPGVNCVFAQDAAAINTKEKHCCILGELNKRAVVTPDVESLLSRLQDDDSFVL